MSKLHLVIADKEVFYVEALTNYILNNYSSRFQISSFTDEEHLCSFLENSDNQFDILLISPELFKASIYKGKNEKVILLSAGEINNITSNNISINKYQSGEKIVSNIIGALSDEDIGELYISSGSKKTRVTAVYSPSGGVGKTSISVGSSLLSSEKGNRVFYLNMETYPSTPIFFDCESNRNFSDVIFHVKNNSRNLALKIEGIRSVDSQSKVHFFSPPESIIDVNECSNEDFSLIIRQLKMTNQYDNIFIDMSTDLDEKTIALLSEADDILLIMTQDEMAVSKIERLLKDFEIISKRNEVRLLDKTNIVLNKFNPIISSKVEYLNNYEELTIFKVPKVPRIFVSSDNHYRLDANSEFTQALRELLTTIL